MDKVKFAIVGCGSVSGNRYFPHIRELGRGVLTAVCDSVEERARHRAGEFSIPCYTNFDELLAKGDFDLLVNLTSIPTHFSLNLRALRAGKHVYTQKPMTVTVEESTTLINEAAKRGLKLVAEDAASLFPHNLVIKTLLDDGVIGKVVWARSRCTHQGPATMDNWPTDPAWYYGKGVGPLRDVGVERLQLLTALLGPAKRVTAMSGVSQPEAVVRSGTSMGKRIKVEEDDLTLILLDFGNATFAMLDVAWVNVRVTRVPDLEIAGQKGVITCSGGTSKGLPVALDLYRDEPQLGIRGWTEVQTIPPVISPPPMQVVGLAHALDCIAENKEPILSGEFARHAIEIIEKAYIAARMGVTQVLETAF